MRAGRPKSGTGDRSGALRALAALIVAVAAGDADARPGAVYEYECDLDGLLGRMTLEIEPVLAAGASWEPGAYPEIARTVGAGGVVLLTKGEIVSPEAYYIFSGANLEADFTLLQRAERLPGRFEEGPGGLIRIVIDPDGMVPTLYFCRMLR